MDPRDRSFGQRKTAVKEPNPGGGKVSTTNRNRTSSKVSPASSRRNTKPSDAENTAGKTHTPSKNSIITKTTRGSAKGSATTPRRKAAAQHGTQSAMGKPASGKSSKTSAVPGRSAKSSKSSKTSQKKRKPQQPLLAELDEPETADAELPETGTTSAPVVTSTYVTSRGQSGQATLNFTHLEETDFYHGFLPRVDAESLVLKQGDFLVRYSQKTDEDPMGYSITVCWDNQIRHLVPKMTSNKKHVRIGGHEFVDVGQLIKFYFNNKKELLGTLLLNPITRPSWELQKSLVELTEKVGEGEFGEVCKGWLNLPSGALPIAVKQCHTETLSKTQLNMFMAEARLMRNYSHPNIVACHGVVVESQPVMIVMELMSGGSLINLLAEHGSKLSLKNRLHYCFDSSAGLRYLHSKRCLHRDIAARNCLIDSAGVVKISDFGLCRQLDRHEQHQEYKIHTKQKLPTRWMAPEMIKTGISSYKTDVWSFGVVVWEIYSDGDVPYPELSQKEVREQLTAGHGYRMAHPQRMPQFVRSIVDGCWAEVPEQRPSFRRINRLFEKCITTQTTDDD